MSNIYNLEPPTKGKVRDGHSSGPGSSAAASRQPGCPAPHGEAAGFCSCGTDPQSRSHAGLRGYSYPASSTAGGELAAAHLRAPPRSNSAQVVLHTTLGDVDIELWPKEAPRAVRNFVQLCLEGYYDGTRFHRVIKDFMVQVGGR